MGTTNNIKELITSEDLLARECGCCGDNFNQDDIRDDNWTILFRTNKDIDWKGFPIKEHRGWINLEIQLEHLACH